MDINELLLSYTANEVDDFMCSMLTEGEVVPRYQYLARELCERGLLKYSPEVKRAILSPKGRDFLASGGFSAMYQSQRRVYWANVRAFGTRDLIVATISALFSVALSKLLFLFVALRF